MMSEGFLIAMLIWLVLLTLLLMTILVGTVALCVELRSRREKQEENDLIDLGKELNSVDSRSLHVQNAAILHPNEYEYSAIEEQPSTDHAKLRMRDEMISNFPLETIETKEGEDLLGHSKEKHPETTLLSEIANPIYIDDDEASEKPQTNDVMTTTEKLTTIE